MRLAARLFASVLLLTLSLPVGAALADPGDTLVIGLSTTEVAGVVDHSLTVTAQLAGITDPLYAGTVTFSSSDSNPGASLPADYTFTVDDAGTHTFDLTLATAGLQSVTATDTGDSSITGSADTTVSAGAATTIDMSATDTSDLASGSTRDISALVEDAFGNPVIGQSVTFSKTAGSGSVSGLGSPSTDDSGTATDTVTGATAGAITITGTTAGAGTDAVSLAVVAGDPNSLVLAGSVSNLASGTNRTLTATLTDAASNPISGQTVVFGKTTGTGTVSGLTSAITNGSGVATDIINATLVGSITIEASDGGVTSNDLTFTIVAGVAAHLTVSGSSSNLASGSTRDVTATLTDAAGNAVSGQTIVFTKSAGSGTVTGLTSPTTGASGIVTDTVTGIGAGPATITATLGGLHDALSFSIVAGPAAHINLAGATTPLTSGSTRIVTATVTDANSNPVQGDTVVFSQSAGSGSVTGFTSPTSDGSGMASDTLTGLGAGSVTVLATDGGLTKTLTFTVVAGSASSLVVSGSSASLASGATRGVTATVTDAAGNPVSGEQVFFTKSAGTGTVSGLTSPTTGASGVVTDTVTGVLAGPVTITATDGGLHDALTFTVTPGAVNHITVSPSTSSMTPGSQSYTTIAFDTAGNQTDVTGTAVLTILPDGSCDTTSCSAASVGAHTVTSTYLTKTDTATLTILNVAPTATDDSITVLEGAASTAVPVLSNDTDPNGDTLVVTAVSTPSHGTATKDAGGGGVHYQPAAHFNGSDSFNYSISDGNGGVDTATVTVTITHVNQVPSFVKGTNQTVLENSSPPAVSGWATSLSPGLDPTESGQALSFIVSNDNNGLFSAQPSIASDGTLSYTPAVDTNGVATVSVQIHDDGGTANGGVDTSAIQTFTITVTLVNQAPTFTKGSDQTVLEDAGPVAVPGWASPISSGPGDPSQTLNFIVTDDNNPLFSSPPAVSPSGALTFTTAPNANGSTIVSVTLHDDGGTANGGADTSATQTFTISVTAVNDAPSFVVGGTFTTPTCPASGTSITCGEESSPVTHTLPAWTHGFSPGPPDEAGQTVLAYNVTNDHHNLFSVQPAIDTSGQLTFKLAANRNGVSTVTVSVQDSGGTANGGIDTSATQTFTITITGVDHPPAAITDTATVVQGSGPNTIDVLANDFDPDGDPLTIIGLIQGADGHAAIAADKQSVTYDPTGLLTGTDQFQYELSDGRGDVAFGTVVVTIEPDTFGPVATAPKIVAVSTTSTTVSINLKWSGTDVGSGVKYYQLQESRNSGTFVSVTVPVGATTASRTVTNGSTYTYRVRGIDQVGNVGAWVSSAAFVPATVPRPAPPTRGHGSTSFVQVATLGSNSPLRVTRRGATVFVIQP
ncbi:MAG TPA: Ig-like domain-containing protein [Candidatus Limnocylindrales bacterium]|nr:Ig-like domain-containing protein [Candidatus Limnocylindrales bacterium]